MLTDQEKQGKEQQWSPFVGPRPFKRDSEDQKIFFGRDDEAEQILSLIYAHPLVLIYAQSGAGKTSILNAQVAPELEKNGFEVLPTARVGIGSRDDTKGKYNTTKTVAVHDYDDGSGGSSYKATNPYILNTLQGLAPELDISLLNSKSLSEFLRDQFPHKLNQREKPIPQVIIFDQLEELFSLYSDPNRWREQQQDFFKQVGDALDGDPLLRVVFVIREDYLAQLDPFAYFLPEKLKARFRLERLHKDAAFEAVKGPLEEAKSYIDGKLIDKLFDERIIDKLIEDLLNIRVEIFGGKSREIKGEFVEPIQLQVVCQRLWNKLKVSQIDQITQENFAYLGDVDKALEDFYVEAIGEASKQTGIEEGVIRNWFEQNLITTSGTRGIVHRGFKSTGGIANKAVGILEKKYLIRKEERSGAQWYELTHDRLIKPIKDSNEKWKQAQEVTIRITPIILAKRRLVNGMRKAFRSKQSLAFIAVIITLAFFALLPYIPKIIPGNEPCAKTSDIQVPIGGFPEDVAINEKINSIYITTNPSSPNDPSIKVVDCTKYNEAHNKESILEKGASKIAIDPKTNLIYVANTGNNTASVIKDDASNNFSFSKEIRIPNTTN